MPAPRNRISRVMHSPLRVARVARIMAVGLSVVLAACAESTPVGPDAQSAAQPTTPAPSPATPLPAFKEPSSPAHIYQETGPLYAFAYTYHGGILVSRYVLYDDGSFALQFASPSYGLFEYDGKYVRSGSEIRFLFNDSNVGGAWNAVGTIDGTKIRVDYNGIMIGADFENGVYLEKPSAP